MEKDTRSHRTRRPITIDEDTHSAEQTTVAELLDRWLEIKTGQVAIGTLTDYERIAKTIAGDELGAMALRRVRSSHLDRFHARLPHGPDRIRRHHNVLSGAFR